MIITRTVTRDYEIECPIDLPIFQFQSFLNQRKRQGSTVHEDFRHCFVCDKAFSNDEYVYHVSVHGLGGMFVCAECNAKVREEDQKLGSDSCH